MEKNDAQTHIIKYLLVLVYKCISLSLQMHILANSIFHTQRTLNNTNENPTLLFASFMIANNICHSVNTIISTPCLGNTATMTGNIHAMNTL